MKITASAYLVQGFYFQQGQILRLGMMPGIGESVVVDTRLCRTMFAGTIWQDDSSEDWQGFLSDASGDSSLSFICLEPGAFVFNKQYLHRTDTIDYHFSMAETDEFWTGHYCGEAVGAGYATCMLTPLPKEMVDPSYIRQKLGVKRP